MLDLDDLDHKFIPPLNKRYGTDGWLEWLEFEYRTQGWVSMCGLNCIRYEPNLQENPTPEETDKYLDDLAIWNEYKSEMGQAAAFVTSRLSFILRCEVRDLETVDQILEKLRELYTQNGNVILYGLIQRFNAIAFDDFQNVTNYGCALIRINNAIGALSKHDMVQDIHMVHKFLQGLPATFDSFRSNFLISRIDTPEFTFNEALRAAENAELVFESAHLHERERKKNDRGRRKGSRRYRGRRVKTEQV